MVKFRLGFVSNSSSSSFVIIGKKIEGSNIKAEMIKRNPQAVGQWLQKRGETVLDDDDVIDCWYDMEYEFKGLVKAYDNNDDLILFEGIKISSDENGYVGTNEYTLPNIKGMKIYTGSEMI